MNQEAGGRLFGGVWGKIRIVFDICIYIYILHRPTLVAKSKWTWPYVLAFAGAHSFCENPNPHRGKSVAIWSDLMPSNSWANFRTRFSQGGSAPQTPRTSLSPAFLIY
jgi:hypothetical protein